jgi:sporulation protein YlmC with PRC-barrel domain
MAMRSFAAVAAAALLTTAAAAQAPQTPSASPSESGAPVATVTEQTKDQWLASQLIGTTVYNSSNERVGSVNDLLLDEKGTPIAFVIKSGGFLGMGGKKVTVDLKSVQMMRTADGDKVIAPLSAEQLKVAADFKAYTPPAPEPPTGATRSPNAMGGPGGMGGGGPAPAPNPAKP